jgi:hypothetical protein
VSLAVACTGALALLSGLLKTFGKGRAPGAVELLPFLEVVTGAVFPFYALTRPLSPGQGGIIIFLILTLVFFSSLDRMKKLRARRRRRTLSEGARLSTYVQHFSDEPEEWEDRGAGA